MGKGCHLLSAVDGHAVGGELELLQNFEVFLGDVGLLDEVFFDYWDIVSEVSCKTDEN